jgi:hypothetical protein
MNHRDDRRRDPEQDRQDKERWQTDDRPPTEATDGGMGGHKESGGGSGQADSGKASKSTRKPRLRR